MKCSLSGTRVAARIEYHGGHYHGWQAQPHLQVSTAQETLEKALALVAGTPVSITCAGRTDTGVHGFAQIIHFDDPVGRSVKAWVMGGNRHLPDDVRLHWALPTRSDFMLGSVRRRGITATFYVIRQLGRPHCMGW